MLFGCFDKFKFNGLSVIQLNYISPFGALSTVCHRLVYYLFMNYKENFAKNLKSLLGGTSIQSFSKQIGIPPQTISRYLLCQREITLEYLIKIADYFHEDIDVLIGRKEY